MNHTLQTRQIRRDLLRNAALIFAAVILAFAALDDITTDIAATFTFERFGLAACAAWLLIVAWRISARRASSTWRRFGHHACCQRSGSVRARTPHSSAPVRVSGHGCRDDLVPRSGRYSLRPRLAVG